MFIEVVVSGWGCFPLACRCGHVCVKRVVISPCGFTRISPSFPCASAWSHSFMSPILRAWCSLSDDLFSGNHCCRPGLKKNFT
jgi:hypothetical protein